MHAYIKKNHGRMEVRNKNIFLTQTNHFQSSNHAREPDNLILHAHMRAHKDPSFTFGIRSSLHILVLTRENSQGDAMNERTHETS